MLAAMTWRATALVGLAVVAVALVVVIGVTTHWSPTSTATGTPGTPGSSASSTSTAGKPRLTAAQRAERRRAAAVDGLLRRNHCWTGQAPAGVTPSHAVVTLPDAEPALVAAEVGFGIWLDGDPGVLHGFCP